MPKPIVCLSEQLCQYVEIFRPCFSKHQWKYFVIVLLGLVECEERKTMTALLRVVGEQVSLSGLSRFLNKWGWSPEKVARTWIRKLGPTLLLITCHDLDEPLKTVRYWGSTDMDLDAQALVDILAVRWEVETFFEYEKDLLGSDQYQAMSRQAMLRFWTLTACLLSFLEEQRANHEDPGVTCGDIRRRLQNDHRQNLLNWLAIRFQEGWSMDQICSQLAL